MNVTPCRIASCLLLASSMLAGCDRGAAPDADAPSTGDPDPGQTVGSMSGLENLIEVRPGVWSGSMPEGEAGFASLAALGVRTVVSVDGARPNVEEAGAHGMRYVHIPVRYNGIDEPDQLALARVFSELERPIYLHCHHGKHRGPSALAVGLIATGELDAAAGSALLDRAGTSPSYPGLFACVREAGPVGPDELAAAVARGEVELAEISTVSGMVEAMAEIDRAWGHLKEIRAAGWRAPDDHPDLVPTAEAGRVVDLLRVSGADEQTAGDAEFARMMAASEQLAAMLEAALVDGDAERSEAAYRALGASCKACHVAYRNE